MSLQILYIEDDEVDAMFFKRQMLNYPIFEYTICKSLNEINATTTYDLVITDANFVDGNYNDTLKYFPFTSIIITSGTKLNENYSNSFFILKPFTIKQLAVSIYTIDYTYLENMCDGDLQFRSQIISTIKQELQTNLLELKKAYANSDIKNLNFYSHKLKNKITILKIPCFDNCLYLEKTNEINEKEKKAFNSTMLYSTLALLQLYTFA